MNVSYVGFVSPSAQSADTAMEIGGGDIFSVLMASVMGGAVSAQWPVAISQSVDAGEEAEAANQASDPKPMTLDSKLEVTGDLSGDAAPASESGIQIPRPQDLQSSKVDFQGAGDLDQESNPKPAIPDPPMKAGGLLPEIGGETQKVESRIPGVQDPQGVETQGLVAQDPQYLKISGRFNVEEMKGQEIKALGLDVLSHGFVSDAQSKTQKPQARIEDPRDTKGVKPGPVNADAGDDDGRCRIGSVAGVPERIKAENQVLAAEIPGKNEQPPGETIRIAELGMQGTELRPRSAIQIDSPLSAPRSSPRNPEPAELIAQITGRMKADFNGKSGEVRMTLHPESLGELKIEVTVDGNVVKANILAENASVKSSIETNLSMLRNSLEGHGLRVDQLSVGVDQRQGNGFARRDEYQGWRHGMEERNPSSYEREESSRQRWHRAYSRDTGLNLFA